MKVGILTFHNTLNYGAQLQAYALQAVLEGWNHDVKLVDYRNLMVTGNETPRMPGPLSMVKHPRSSMYKFLGYPALVERKAAFDRFARERAHLGPRCQHAIDIARRYDVVVVGSDQVWNPSLTGGDAMYFLDDPVFTGVRKVSYAASFGTDSFPADLADRCGRAIRGFDSVSVREESGVHIVREIAGREASLVLDPTLLLDRDAWAALASRPPEGPYVFAYTVAEQRLTLECARREAARRGARLVAIDCYRHRRGSRACEYRTSASPEEFLGLIQGAELVVTSSFHGLALSLAMETDVIYCLDPKRGNKNSRLESLASLAGVEDRNALEEPVGGIDFEGVSERLGEARVSSLEFLEGALR